LSTAPAAVLATVLATAAALVREIREQLVDQTLEHNGRLGLLYPAAFLEAGVRTARAKADVLAAQQTLRLNTGEAVVRNFVVLVVDTQHHNRLEGLGIEVDLVHIAHAYPSDRNGRAHLEVPDVVELR